MVFQSCKLLHMPTTPTSGTLPTLQIYLGLRKYLLCLRLRFEMRPAPSPYEFPNPPSTSFSISWSSPTAFPWVSSWYIVNEFIWWFCSSHEAPWEPMLGKRGQSPPRAQQCIINNKQASFIFTCLLVTTSQVTMVDLNVLVREMGLRMSAPTGH